MTEVTEIPYKPLPRLAIGEVSVGDLIEFVDLDQPDANGDYTRPHRKYGGRPFRVVKKNRTSYDVTDSNGGRVRVVDGYGAVRSTLPWVEPTGPVLEVGQAVMVPGKGDLAVLTKRNADGSFQATIIGGDGRYYPKLRALHLTPVEVVVKA
jgi:hypothetical protein